MLAFLQGLDYSPLMVSLKTGAVATVLCFFLGIFAAGRMVGAGARKKALIDGLLTLPMVLPPTVAGFFLLLIFGRQRPVGLFLYETWDIRVVQTWLGCVIAASVIAFPLMYRSARAAFDQVDVNLIYAARTLGMPEHRIFLQILLPCAAPGITSGTVLTFARALGEYGATSMLAGNIPGKTGTISQKIALVMQDGDYVTAGVWVALMLFIAFAVMVLIHMSAAGARGRRREKRGVRHGA